jgi:hypothetical protein
MTLVEVLDPTAQPIAATTLIADGGRGPDLGALAGKRVGIRHDMLWKSFDSVAFEWARLLEADGAEVILWLSDDRIGPEGAKVIDSFNRWLDDLDAGIFGLGSCGSCTMLTVDDALECAKRDLTSVAVVTEHFKTLGHALVERNGRPDFRLQVLPYPLETRPVEELQEIARSLYPELLQNLGVRS